MKANRIESPDPIKRRRELAKIHLGAKALGIEGDDYRAFLQRIGGAESAAVLDAAGRGAVLDDRAGAALLGVSVGSLAALAAER